MPSAAREWLRVEIDVPIAPLPPELREPDEVAGLLYSSLLGAGCLGIELPAPLPGQPPLAADPLRLVAWFPLDTDPEALALPLAASGLPGARVATGEALADPGWVERFNESLQPIDVGQRFTILPHGGEPKAGRLALHVEPGRAFGTGHHSSTRLALTWVEETVQPGMSVLDVGTGSGILAAACARLGASDVLGRDIDPEAIEVALENLERVPERSAVRYETGGGTGAPAAPRDVVIANITSDIILPMLSDLVAATAPGGTLILAGLLRADEPGVEHELARRGLAAEWRREGEWTSARARRPRP